MASGKRDSWRPAFSWSFTSSSLTKWKVERLTARLLGGGVICCFAFLVGMVVVILHLQKAQKTREKKVLLATSFCLWSGQLPH